MKMTYQPKKRQTKKEHGFLKKEDIIDTLA